MKAKQILAETSDYPPKFLYGNFKYSNHLYLYVRLNDEYREKYQLNKNSKHKLYVISYSNALLHFDGLKHYPKSSVLYDFKGFTSKLKALQYAADINPTWDIDIFEYGYVGQA